MAFKADVKLDAAIHVASPFALEVRLTHDGDAGMWRAEVPALGVRVERADGDEAARDARAKGLRQMADDMSLGRAATPSIRAEQEQRKGAAAGPLAIIFRDVYPGGAS